MGIPYCDRGGGYLFYGHFYINGYPHWYCDGTSRWRSSVGYGSSFNVKEGRYLMATVLIIGASIAIKFGKFPLELIVFAHSVTIFIASFVGTLLYFVANDAKIMGARVNGRFVKIFAGIGLLLIFVLSLVQL